MNGTKNALGAAVRILGMKNRTWTGLVGVGAMALGVSAQTYTLDPVTSGSPAFSSQIGVRYRAFNRPADQEVYIGTNLGSSGGRSSANISYATLPPANPFSIGYDSAAGLLSTTIGGTTTSWAWSPTVASDLRIGLYSRSVNSSTTATVTVADLLLNGIPLGGAPLAVSSSTGSVVSGLWSLSGFDFTSDFTLTGSLNLSAASAFNTSAEGSKMEVYFGNAVPEPSTYAAIGAGAGLVGWRWLRRRRNVR